MPDKVIVTNLDELKRKYGTAGVASVKVAVDKLIAADAVLGIVSVLVDLSDSGTMAAYGFAPIPDMVPLDPVLYKDAVDKVYAHFAPSPDYLMLLGSVDVIPHIPLDNPLHNQIVDLGGDPDPDEQIPSDLPYASDQPYSANAQDFIAPTRIVGRLPNVKGDHDPAYLVGLLDTAATYKQSAASDYSKFLGVSAEAWATSTDLSLDAIFGTYGDAELSPPREDNWTLDEAKSLSHFVNCHGAHGHPYFYGATPPAIAVALSAARIGPMIAEGTVMTAECCYGAELYNPYNPAESIVLGQNGMCNTYLGNKAYAYFGSTNTSYGQTTGTDRADVICKLFSKHLLGGASAGRACLEARLEYVSGLGHSPTPDDVKTLAQFNLMADPSLTPVASTPRTVIALSRNSPSSARAAVERHARQNRRATLAALSSALWTYRLGKPKVPRGRVIVAKLQELAEANGIEPPYVMLTYPYGSPPPDTQVPGPPPKAVHVIMKRLPSPPNLPALVLVRLIEAIEYEEALDVHVLESR